jgi:hypothetical protein
VLDLDPHRVVGRVEVVPDEWPLVISFERRTTRCAWIRCIGLDEEEESIVNFFTVTSVAFGRNRSCPASVTGSEVWGRRVIPGVFRLRESNEYVPPLKQPTWFAERESISLPAVRKGSAFVPTPASEPVAEANLVQVSWPEAPAGNSRASMIAPRISMVTPVAGTTGRIESRVGMLRTRPRRRRGAGAARGDDES